MFETECDRTIWEGQARSSEDVWKARRGPGVTHPAAGRKSPFNIPGGSSVSEGDGRGGYGAEHVADAFAEIYATHAAWLHRVALALVSDPEVAADLVADAFVRFHQPFHDGRVGDNRAYLRRTLANLAADHLRRRAVRRRFSVQRSGDHRGQVSHEDEWTLREEVSALLDRLPPQQRVAVVMRFYVDATDVEIADVLRCRPGTARSHISRGLTALRSDLSAGVLA